jgi:glycosyltransferase involved in cell wall biosynthesis
VLGGAAARRAGFPTVATVHGAIGGSLKNRLYMWVQHRALRRSGAVVAVSAVIAEKLTASGVPASRVYMVRNAWSPTSASTSRDEARAELGVKTDGPVLGWVGRLSPEKAVDVFLDALPPLAEHEVTAVVIGEGSELEPSRRQAERLAVSDRVRFCGAVPDAARLFAAIDCLVLSSHTEGTPMVLLEAMSARVPIVVTRVGGVPDVVSEREARLVPAADPPALAEAIRDVLRDPDAAASRADAAERRLHSEFGVERWLREYDAIYRTVAETR